MKIIRLLQVASAAFFIAGAAHAQQLSIPNHALPIGKGVGQGITPLVGAADTVLMGNGASADPAAVAVTNCNGSSNALNYNTSTHAFSCNNISTSGVTLLSGTVLAKTANYTALTADCGDSITLGGSAQFTLTLSAASGYSATCGYLITNLASETRSKTLAINGLTSFFLYPGQSIIVTNQSNTWNVGPTLGRWRLIGAVTMYVRPDGSDSNDGLANSAGGAFLTPNAAFAAVSANIDINNRTDFVVRHTCAAPPCTITAVAQLLSMVNVYFVGGVPTFQGDCTTPANMILAPSAPGNIGDIRVSLSSPLNVCGFKLAGGTNAEGMYISGSHVTLTGPMTFDDVTNGIDANSQALVALDGNITISHGMGAFLVARHGGFIENGQAITITTSGTPAWANAFAQAIFGGTMVLASTITFAGTGATGVSALVTTNSTIDNNGGNCTGLPGGGTVTLTTNGLCF